MNRELVQKIFHVAQNDFSGEVVEDFLQFVAGCGKNFSAENFYREIVVAFGERQSFRRENFFTVERQNFLRGLSFNGGRRGEKILFAEDVVNFFLDLRQGVTVAKIINAIKVGHDCELRGVKSYVGHVADDLRKLLAQGGVVGKIFQRGTNFFLLDICAAGENFFHGAESLNQFGRRFFPDAFDARNVIGRVAAQALEVDEERGREAVFGAEFFFVVNVDARIFVEQNFRRCVDQLERVAVSRQNFHGIGTGD